MKFETQAKRTPATKRWDSWLIGLAALILILAVLLAVAFVVYLFLHGIAVPDPKVAD